MAVDSTLQYENHFVHGCPLQLRATPSEGHGSESSEMPWRGDLDRAPHHSLCVMMKMTTRMLMIIKIVTSTQSCDVPTLF